MNSWDFEEPRTRFPWNFKKKNAIALLNFDHRTKILLGMLSEENSRKLNFDLKRKRQGSSKNRFERRDLQKNIPMSRDS